MKIKRNAKSKLTAAYLKKQRNPSGLDIFAINHLRSRFVWAFIK